MKFYPSKFPILLMLFTVATGCRSVRPIAQDSDQIPLLKEKTTHLQLASLAPFYHGVASGDPFSESVVLWTRVTPKTQLPLIEVEWEIGNSNFTQVVAQGQVSTGPERDYTVKLIAEGLEPGTDYYYRFKALGKTSEIGHTRTAALTSEELQFGVVSCSNVEFGYFNAYAALAEENLDAILHLGDYIYEYGAGGYGNKAFNRKNIPDHEILSLEDYRDRYAQYRLDPDLRAVHAQHAFIPIWDDHEITNNAYVNGAQNHQKNEGSYDDRKAIAKQVYYEWMPIREGITHYRKFSFGSMADLFMLDERLAARTIQPDSLTDPQRTKSTHQLLGQKQMSWLKAGIQSSDAHWKIIGNQVIFSYSDWGHASFSRNMDAWDGYPREQAELTEFLKENGNGEVVFVTGDTHTAWAFEVTNDPFNGYNQSSGEGAVALEFGVTSITSGNSNERFPTEQVLAHEKKISTAQLNPHLRYVNMRDHGYLKLSLTKETLKAEYKIVPTLLERTSESKVDTIITARRGIVRLNGE